jgi:branched-chain amino acid aminotransferase
MDLGSLQVYAGGRFCRYDEAKVGLLTHALNYGTGCFEGVRGYWEPHESELYLLSLREHYERLHDSARLLMMKLPLSPQEMCEITTEVCARNHFEVDLYVRPLAYKSAEAIGVKLHGVEDAFAIIAVPFTAYYDNPGGLKCCTSAWRRMDDTVAPARGKITGVYVNSALAKSEAILSGYDEAILLSHDGHVSEGSAENIFIVKNGVIYTPDCSQNILEGITRRTVMMLARDHMDLQVVERAIDRSELYSSDEVFFTGSAVGVQWVQSVDHRPIADGELGPVTQRLTELYDQLTHGKLLDYRAYLTPVYASRKVATR